VFLYNSINGDPYEGKTISLTYSQVGLEDARRPKIAIDPDDNLYVVWHDSPGGRQTALYQVWSLDNNGDLSLASDTDILNELGSSAQNPRMSVSQDDVYVTWGQVKSENDPDNQYGVILDNLSDTLPFLALTRDSNDESAYEPRIATGGGAPQLVWHELSSVDNHDLNTEAFYWKQSFVVAAAIAGDDEPGTEKFWMLIFLIAIALALAIYFVRARLLPSRSKVRPS
jgi:hypothetical protein